MCMIVSWTDSFSHFISGKPSSTPSSGLKGLLVKVFEGDKPKFRREVGSVQVRGSFVIVS